MKPWLTPSDLQALTQRQRPSAQIKQLEAMGIEYRMRGDGSIVVLTSALGELPPARDKRAGGPDLSMV